MFDCSIVDTATKSSFTAWHLQETLSTRHNIPPYHTLDRALNNIALIIMLESTAANTRIIATWMDDVEVEIQMLSIHDRGPPDAWPRLLGKETASSHTTKKRSRLEDAQLNLALVRR